MVAKRMTSTPPHWKRAIPMRAGSLGSTANSRDAEATEVQADLARAPPASVSRCPEANAEVAETEARVVYMKEWGTDRYEIGVEFTVLSPLDGEGMTELFEPELDGPEEP